MELRNAMRIFLCRVLILSYYGRQTRGIKSDLLNSRKEELTKIFDHSVSSFYWPWHLRPDYIFFFSTFQVKLMIFQVVEYILRFYFGVVSFG